MQTQQSYVNDSDSCRRLFFFLFHKAGHSKFQRFSIYYLVIYFCICAMNSTFIISLLDCLKPLGCLLSVLIGDSQPVSSYSSDERGSHLLGKKENLCTKDNSERDCCLISKQAREYFVQQDPLGYSLKHPDWVSWVRAKRTKRGQVCGMCTTVFICSVLLICACTYD